MITNDVDVFPTFPIVDLYLGSLTHINPLPQLHNQWIHHKRSGSTILAKPWQKITLAPYQASQNMAVVNIVRFFCPQPQCVNGPWMPKTCIFKYSVKWGHTRWRYTSILIFQSELKSRKRAFFCSRRKTDFRELIRSFFVDSFSTLEYTSKHRHPDITASVISHVL